MSLCHRIYWLILVVDCSIVAGIVDDYFGAGQVSPLVDIMVARVRASRARRVAEGLVNLRKPTCPSVEDNLERGCAWSETDNMILVMAA